MKMIGSRTGLCFIVGLMLVVVTPAFAEDTQRWLPSADLYSAADTKKLFELVHIDPNGNPDLGVQILKPIGWKSADIVVSADQAKQDGQTQIPLAQIAPDTGDDVATEIRYQRVPESVSPSEFLTLYAQSDGCEIIARQHADFNGKPVEDALLKSQSALTGTMLTRMTVVRRGDYIFMLRSTAQEKEYPKWKRVFGAAAVSFEPKSRAGNTTGGAVSK